MPLRVNKFYWIQVAASSIGALVAASGLLLLTVLVVFITRTGNDGWLEFSINGFLVSFGLLVSVCICLYFIWIGFSILFLKKISTMSLVLIAMLPAFLVSMTAASFIKDFGYRLFGQKGFFATVLLVATAMVVFLFVFAVIAKNLTKILGKGGYFTKY